MKQGSWARVEQLYALALSKSPRERKALLANAHKEDPELAVLSGAAAFRQSDPRGDAATGGVGRRGAVVADVVAGHHERAAAAFEQAGGRRILGVA